MDDIIITGSNSAFINSVITELSHVFELKDIWHLKYFLGLEFNYISDSSMFVSQTRYARELLKKTSMDTCKPCSPPSKPYQQVLDNAGEPLFDHTLYRSLVGALQYLTFMRPNIVFSVNTVCQFMHSPTDFHFSLVKCIMCYLQGMLASSISFSTGFFHLSGLCDAD